MAGLKQWCDDINQAQQKVRFDFIYVDEESYRRYRPSSFSDVIRAFRKYKE
jgi:type III restriction enzyme